MTALHLADDLPRPAGPFAPPTPLRRAQVRQTIDRWVHDRNIQRNGGGIEHLRHLATTLSQLEEWPDAWRDWIAVHIGNALMHDALARIPFERRLLMLPKCLRDSQSCTAPIDGIGLICQRCGHCCIAELEEEALRLGYAVLVAEGSAVVMAILQKRQIDAVIGISCLGVLERAFTYLEMAGIPGLAIPLLQDDCRDTSIDLAWVWDALHLHELLTDAPPAALDRARTRVDALFTPDSLARIMGSPATETESLAQRWILQGGKRWRPLLTAALCEAAGTSPGINTLIDHALLAVECFHKASLIHDDIEDSDPTRYDLPTLHTQIGLPAALNVGDLLVGEGYRLLSAAPTDDSTHAALTRAAAEAHRQLCLGQGMELAWQTTRNPMTVDEVLAIMRLKTAPAFAVALKLGALAAGLGESLFPPLERYADALGIAYQIRDDLQDALDDAAQRPSILLALAWEQAIGYDKDLISRAWHGAATPELPALLTRLAIPDHALHLLERWKHAALDAADETTPPDIRAILRRIILKVFSKPELEGWCRDVAARHAPGDPPRTGSTR